MGKVPVVFNHDQKKNGETEKMSVDHNYVKLTSKLESNKQIYLLGNLEMQKAGAGGEGGRRARPAGHASHTSVVSFIMKSVLVAVVVLTWDDAESFSKRRCRQPKHLLRNLLIAFVLLVCFMALIRQHRWRWRRRRRRQSRRDSPPLLVPSLVMPSPPPPPREAVTKASSTRCMSLSLDR